MATVRRTKRRTRGGSGESFREVPGTLGDDGMLRRLLFLIRTKQEHRNSGSSHGPCIVRELYTTFLVTDSNPLPFILFRDVFSLDKEDREGEVEGGKQKDFFYKRLVNGTR